MTDYSPETKALLRPYVTNTDEHIYCLRNLPPEVTAVLFAYVSRSSASFRDNLVKLLGEGDLDIQAMVSAEDGDEFERASEKARKFHEKWVVGYGHASVAEHADLKFAIEDVSIIASKIIEDNRLGAYTEKSSRYQVFYEDRFFTPPELVGHALEERYKAFNRKLLGAYMSMYEEAEAKLKDRHPREDGISQRGYNATMRAKALDVVRYLLPSSSLTSIGMSVNARVAAHAINKMLSHPLAEMNEIGRKMLSEGQKVCPALLKYVDDQPHLRHTFQAFSKPAAELGTTPESSTTTPEPLTNRCLTDQPEATLAAGLLYADSGLPFDELLSQVSAWPDEKVDALIADSLAHMGGFDWPSRAFERVVFRSEIVVDYGAYRDIQRHRMNTQTPQILDCSLGYDMPEDIAAFGLEDRYRSLMDEAAALHEDLLELGPHVASYVVPFAYRIRVSFDWNLREVFHFIRLRSGREGHISYRSVAQRLYLAIQASHPRLAKWLAVDMNEYDLERLEGEKKLDRKLGISES